MNTDFFKQFPGAGPVSSESLQELGGINARTLQKLAGLQLQIGMLGIEGGIEQAKLISASPNYGELFQAQGRFGAAMSERLLEIGREAADTLGESREAWIAWITKAAQPAGGREPAQAAGGSASKPRSRRTPAKKAA